MKKFKIVVGEKLGLGNMGLLSEMVETHNTAKKVKAKALEVLQGSNWNEILEEAGVINNSEAASAALKAVIAERITQYTVRAMKEARKRGTKLGAAAIIIAASRAK
jgi:hypothetical protein